MWDMKEQYDYTGELLGSLSDGVSDTESSVVKLSMPHFLYQTTKQAHAYEAATYKSNAYREKLDKPISKLIEDNIEGLCEDLSKKIHFIDLGPGYPSKSLRIIDELKAHDHIITYFPVDVSLFFLKRATSAVASRGIHYNSLQERFEDLAPVLDRGLIQQEGMRYIFLGLTFNNFEPHYISNILSELTNKGDRCVICCQSPMNIENGDLTLPYKTDAVDRFCFLPLELVGLRRKDFDFNVVYEENAIRVQYLSKKNLKAKDILIPKGTRLETSSSYRYDLERVRDAVEKYFLVRNVYSSEQEHMHLLSLQSI